MIDENETVVFPTWLMALVFAIGALSPQAGFALLFAATCLFAIKAQS